MGRRCTIGPRVCLAGGRDRPIVLGTGVRLKRGVILSTADSGRIEVEDDVSIGEYAVVTSNAVIRVGRGTVIGSHVDLVDFNHRFDDLDCIIADQPSECVPIRIGRGVRLGAGAQVLAGVTIGDRAVVAAGAVVTRDVPEGATAAGVPARVVEAGTETETGPE